MKALYRFVMALVCCLAAGTFSAQTSTPSGLFDQVSDRYGKTYRPSELEISGAATFSSCQSGMFKLYYANGSGMESSTLQRSY